MARKHDDSRSGNLPPHASDAIYAVLLILPMVLLLGVFTFGAVREMRAEREVDATLVALDQRGVSVDGNDSLRETFDRRTSKENSARWGHVLDATEAIESRFFSGYQIEDYRDVVPPDQPWDAELFAERYSVNAQAILSDLEKLLKKSNTVWQPVIFDDYQTLLPELQQTRSLARLLTTEFSVAYHSDDHERALHSLSLMGKVAEAFDWQTFLVGDLIYLAHLGQHRGLIRKSLATEYWTADELDQLRQQLAFADDLDVRWERMVDTELTMMRGSLGLAGNRDKPTVHDMGVILGPFGIAPTHEQAILHEMQRMRSIAGTGSDTHRRQTEDVNAELHDHLADPSATSVVAIPFATPSTVMGLLMPAFVAASEAYTRTERERRWTVCAVAIKQFEMQQDRWPESLEELEQVGLSQADWEATPGQPFGYQVSDDGNEVFLWTKVSTETDLEPVPPHTIEKHDSMLDSLEVTIR